MLQAKLNTRLTDAIRMDASVRWFKSNEVQQYHEPRGTYDSNREGILDMVRREFRDQKRDSDALATAVNFIADTELAGLDHQILFGGDWYREDAILLQRTARASNAGGPVPDACLTNRVYGLTSGAAYNLSNVRPTIHGPPPFPSRRHSLWDRPLTS